MTQSPSELPRLEPVTSIARSLLELASFLISSHLDPTEYINPDVYTKITTVSLRLLQMTF